MASGLPVIATRVGGNAELVDDATTGTLVPAADAEALAQRDAALRARSRSSPGRRAVPAAPGRSGCSASTPWSRNTRRSTTGCSTIDEASHLPMPGGPPHARRRGATDHVRHHGHLRHARAQRHRSRDAGAHERVAASSRPRRGRPAHRARRRAGPPAAVDHRPFHRAAAAVQRGPQRLHRLQRRDLQLPGADRRADGAGPPFPHQERHRGDRARLGGVGRGLRRALARHVRVRAVGSQPARRCSSRATASASSRCTTRCCPTARCCSAPS